MMISTHHKMRLAALFIIYFLSFTTGLLVAAPILTNSTAETGPNNGTSEKVIAAFTTEKITEVMSETTSATVAASISSSIINQTKSTTSTTTTTEEPTTTQKTTPILMTVSTTTIHYTDDDDNKNNGRQDSSPLSTASTISAKPRRKPSETIENNNIGEAIFSRQLTQQIGDTGMFEFALFLIAGFSVAMAIYTLWVYREKIFSKFRRHCLSSDWRQITGTHENVNYQSLIGQRGNNGTSSSTTRPNEPEMDQIPLTHVNSDDEDEDDFFGSLNAARTPLNARTGTPQSQAGQENILNSVRNYVF